MEQTATLRIQTDESGNKFIAGIKIGDMTISKLYIKPDDSDEQRCNAALESRVSMLESALTVTQVQLNQATINDGSVEKISLL